jgi:hypothetical protein
MITAGLVWVSTALLSRAEPNRTGFSHDEIRRKVYAIEPDHGKKDSTVRTHIAKHCVANKPPYPGTHRTLFVNPDGTYRLFQPGDKYDPDRRNGQVLSKTEELPAKYRNLLEWYTNRNRTNEISDNREARA